VGVAFGWMWAEGEERHWFFASSPSSALRAAMLGCATVMSPVDKGKGQCAASRRQCREVGDLAAAARVRLAVGSTRRRISRFTGRIREVLTTPRIQRADCCSIPSAA
jgi:hypothetical protein